MIADEEGEEARGRAYVAVADAAPVIGITAPVEVGDPLCYQGIDGLTAVPKPQAGTGAPTPPRDLGTPF